MRLSPRHWTATQLFGAWIAYWAVLLAIFLRTPLSLFREIRALPPGRASSTLGFGDQGFNGQVVIDHVTRWQSHVSFGAVGAWLLVPPLVLWVLWIAMRPRPIAPTGPPSQLRDGATVNDFVSQRERQGERR